MNGWTAAPQSIHQEQNLSQNTASSSEQQGTVQAQTFPAEHQLEAEGPAPGACNLGSGHMDSTQKDEKKRKTIRKK